jgi:hypothetical protein
VVGRSALAITAAAVLAACEGGARPAPAQHIAEVAVSVDRMRLETGPVGEEKFRSEATYLLVDARNTGRRDLLVTLRGRLVDAAGAVVGDLREQMLRIPAGGERMFSLVDRERLARPRATRAEVTVVEAVEPSYPPSVIIADGNVTQDLGRAVVQGNVVNTAEREVAAIIVFGFYGADGRPMKQSSTRFEIAAKQTRGAMMVGPPGSTAATMFVGEYAH